MATIRRFEDLQIWQCANALYKELRYLIMKIRANKDFRFAEQLKSAAGSIMDNIAEGFERNSRREFIQSPGISAGECGEVKSQLYRALNDEYLKSEEFEKLYEMTDKTGRKIASMIKYLNGSVHKGLKFKDRV